eukprot:5233138-Ditylum_brightwellii.AAC.2
MFSHYNDDTLDTGTLPMEEVGQGQEELELDESGTTTNDIKQVAELPMERWQSPTEISDVNIRISVGFPPRC